MTDWPPRFKITPEGTANLFLLAVPNRSPQENSDVLVKLFREFFEAGYKAGKAEVRDE